MKLVVDNSTKVVAGFSEVLGEKTAKSFKLCSVSEL